MEEEVRGQKSEVSEDALVREHDGLVKTIAWNLSATLPAHVDLAELYSAGLLGLLRALRKFNPARQVQFASYASVVIRGAMMDDLRRKDWVPRLIRRKARRIRAVAEGLERRTGCPPTDGQIARGLKISVPCFRKWTLEVAPRHFFSLDVAAPADDDAPRHDDHYEDIPDPHQENPGEVVARTELATLAVQRIERMRDPARTVMHLYYVRDMRQVDIGKLFGTTDARIGQIRAEALGKLRMQIGPLIGSVNPL